MIVYEQVRCPACNRRLVDMCGQAQIRCPKCKSLVEIDTVARKIYIKKQSVKKQNANDREVILGRWRFYILLREQFKPTKYGDVLKKPKIKSGENRLVKPKGENT